MSYDEDLAERLREVLAGERDLSEKRMFGGLAFLVGGRMAVAASHSRGLLLRCDPAETDELIADPVADRFIMKGREMDGWLHVHLDADVDDETLERWVAKGVTYARSLPKKGKK